MLHTYHFSHFITKFQIIKLQGKSCKDLIIFEFKFLKILDLLEKLMFANFILNLSRLIVLNC